ncbi:MAG: hypothetical protein GF393_13010, partial [Armatimonadia bacterium]|nr:hypothetical protein [Armatimonadia bacterium]
EPGIFDKRLGIREFPSETFETAEPNVVVAHNANTTGRKLQGRDAEPKTTLAPWGSGLELLKRIYHTQPELRMPNIRSARPRQHSYIGSAIFDIDDLMARLLDYADRRRPGRAEKRIKILPEFVRKVADGTQFDDAALELEPYFAYLVELLNPRDRIPKLTRKGKRHVIKLMREMERLYADIRDNGLKSPLDMWREGKDRMVLHRGWRRLIIIAELHRRGLRDFARVPIRVYKSKEIFQKYSASTAWNAGAMPGNSIHSLAVDQFTRLKEKATDKYWVHGYTSHYDVHFAPLRDKPIRLLEIGVFRGASLLLWKHAFPKGLIYGVDKNTAIWKELLRKQQRVQVFVGRQEDRGFLQNTVVPAGPYDVIIDDGGHEPEQQMATFEALWPHVNSGGYFVIEDLHGNYWSRRAKKGPKMMEKIKSMLDDTVGTNDRHGIRAIAAYYNIVFIQKL